MSNDARCECGCRIFFNKQTVITTTSGTIRDIPAMMVIECVRCARTYSVGTEEGKKTLSPFSSGYNAEKALFKAALESWINRDRPESNASLIVTEEGDKADFARLGL